MCIRDRCVTVGGIWSSYSWVNINSRTYAQLILILSFYMEWVPCKMNTFLRPLTEKTSNIIEATSQFWLNHLEFIRLSVFQSTLSSFQTICVGYASRLLVNASIDLFVKLPGMSICLPYRILFYLRLFPLNLGGREAKILGDQKYKTTAKVYVEYQIKGNFNHKLHIMYVCIYVYIYFLFFATLQVFVKWIHGN